VCVCAPRWGAQLAAPRPAQRTTLTATLEPSATNGSVSGPGVVGPPPRAVLGRTVSPCRRRRLVAFRIGDDRSLLRTTPSDRRFRPPIPAHARRRTACIALRAVATARVVEEPPVQERPVETQPQALSEVHTTFSRVCHIRVVPTTATRLYLGPIRVLGSASHTVSAELTDRTTAGGTERATALEVGGIVRQSLEKQNKENCE